MPPAARPAAPTRMPTRLRRRVSPALTNDPTVAVVASRAGVRNRCGTGCRRSLNYPMRRHPERSDGFRVEEEFPTPEILRCAQDDVRGVFRPVVWALGHIIPLRRTFVFFALP